MKEEGVWISHPTVMPVPQWLPFNLYETEVRNMKKSELRLLFALVDGLVARYGVATLEDALEQYRSGKEV